MNPSATILMGDVNPSSRLASNLCDEYFLIENLTSLGLDVAYDTAAKGLGAIS